MSKRTRRTRGEGVDRGEGEVGERKEVELEDGEEEVKAEQRKKNREEWEEDKNKEEKGDEEEKYKRG